MSEGRDEQIHGPEYAGLVQTGNREEGGGELPMDLSKTSIFEDLRALVFRPSDLFAYFRSPSAPHRRVVFKALLGFCLASWIGGIVSGFRGIAKIMDPNLFGPEAVDQFALIESRLGISHLREMLTAAVVSFSQLTMFIAPLYRFMGILFWAAATIAMLPLLGVDRRKLSFLPLLMAGCYAEWLRIVVVLPGIGAFAAWVWIFVVSIIAVKSIYKIGAGRALVATSLLLWVSWLVLAFAIVLSLMVWSFSLR